MDLATHTWLFLINGQIIASGLPCPTKAYEALTRQAPNLPSPCDLKAGEHHHLVSLRPADLRTLCDILSPHLSDHCWEDYPIFVSFDRTTALLRVFGLGFDLRCPGIPLELRRTTSETD
jgi:hypothetical protein